jgi:hypothetical protein
LGLSNPTLPSCAKAPSDYQRLEDFLFRAVLASQVQTIGGLLCIPAAPRTTEDVEKWFHSLVAEGTLSGHWTWEAVKLVCETLSLSVVANMQPASVGIHAKHFSRDSLQFDVVCVLFALGHVVSVFSPNRTLTKRSRNVQLCRYTPLGKVV